MTILRRQIHWKSWSPRHYTVPLVYTTTCSPSRLPAVGDGPGYEVVLLTEAGTEVKGGAVGEQASIGQREGVIVQAGAVPRAQTLTTEGKLRTGLVWCSSNRG